MADKRISQLIERTDIANNDVLPIVASGATITNKVTISTIQNWMQDNLDVGVTSVGITIGSTGTDVNVTGSPITTSGNITINIPTASATNRGLLSSTDWSTFNNKVPYTGAVADVDLGQRGIDARYFALETSPATLPGNQGSIYWDTARSTAALIMNGTTQHIGQDSFFYVKNSTGSTIAKGTCVGFAGTDGASGHLLIQPFLANGLQPSTYFMGVTAEAITNGSFGQVMHFGELTGVNTSGYTAGALLYASTTVAGSFQTTAPQAPNNIILVAAAVNSTNNGTIVVRPQLGSNINTDEGVKITSVGDKDLLQYQSGTGLWENKTRDAAGVVTTDTTQTITGLKTFSGSSLRLAANGTADAVVLRNVSGTTGSDSGATTMGFNGNDNLFISTQSRGGFILGFNNSVSNREYTLPDASGTLALTSNLSSYLPLSGGTLTGALNGTSASFSGRLLAGTSTGVGNDFTSIRFNSADTFSQGMNMVDSNASASGSTFQVFRKSDDTYVGNIRRSGTDNAIFIGGNSYLALGANNTEFFRIASTGNVGIGTTSPGQALDVYRDTSTASYVVARNGSGVQVAMGVAGDNGSLLGTLSNHNLRIVTNGAVVSTITSSGNVGIGTASPSQLLHVKNDQAAYTWSRIDNQSTSSSAYSGLQLAASGNTWGIAIGSSAANSNALTFVIDAGGGNTERMRITSGGDVLIGKSSFTSNSLRIDGNGILSNSRGGTGTNSHCNFFNDNGLVGSITTSGSSTSYNTSSDYRLKENVKPVENALSVLTQLKPCTFNFIADADEEVMGFIAHEVQEVIPQAVIGEKDEVRIEQVEVSPAELDEEGNVITEAIIEEKEVPVYQGIDHSKLVPLLVASIQELKAEIEALKSQING